MSGLKTRIFEGTVDSTNPALQGLHPPAKLTLIEHDDEYECHFAFILGAPIRYIILASKSAGTSIEGTTQDPRGWDVSFVAELIGDCVTGTYNQPHDHGTFTLKEV